MARALAAGEISGSGRFVEAFESAWAKYCGRSYGVAVANGTVALELAVACLDLSPGDEIAMPAFTIVSCALAALRNGAVPRLVDVDPRTGCMDPASLASAVTQRTRAVMPVHMYGHPADMARILETAASHGLTVIEDAAEAHGSECHAGTLWRRCGGFGDVSCFSFYANKPVTTGEGGMLVTDDARIADRARSLRNLAFDPQRRFRHVAKGFNFRMSSIQAALGLPQVARMPQIVARKRAVAAAYSKHLQGVRGLQLPTEESWARSIYWMYGVVLDDEVRVERVRSALEGKGVETRPFFWGLHEQPAFAGEPWTTGSFPVTERLSRRGFYLPSSPTLTDAQIEQVAGTLRRSLES